MKADIDAMLAAAETSDDPIHAIQSEAISQAEGDVEQGLEFFKAGRKAWNEQ